MWFCWRSILANVVFFGAFHPDEVQSNALVRIVVRSYIARCNTINCYNRYVGRSGGFRNCAEGGIHGMASPGGSPGQTGHASRGWKIAVVKIVSIAYRVDTHWEENIWSLNSWIIFTSSTLGYGVSTPFSCCCESQLKACSLRVSKKALSGIVQSVSRQDAAQGDQNWL